MTDAVVTDTNKSQVRTGASELLHHRNPFYVTSGRGLFAIVAAFAVALLGYTLCIYWINVSLVNSIERADPMVEVLRGSSTYTLSSPGLDAGKDLLVDDLAIATWIRHYKLVSPDTELSDVLTEPRFELLRAALRFGSHCPPNGAVEPLRMPVVQRIVALASFLSGPDCGTATGQGPDLGSIAIVVRNISAIPAGEFRTFSGGGVTMDCDVGHPIRLDSAPFIGAATSVPSGRTAIGCPDMFASTTQLSGKQVFKIILERGSSFERLDTPPPTSFVDQGKARADAESALQKAKTDLDAKRKELADKEKERTDSADPASFDAQVTDLQTQVNNLDEQFKQAEATHSVIVANALSPEVKFHEQARAALFALDEKRRLSKAGTLDDPQVQAIEDFAIALMASVDTNAGVSSARQLLAAARGGEQFLIIALFLIVGALMLERALAFRRRGQEIDKATSRIKADVIASDAEKAREDEEAAAAAAAAAPTATVAQSVVEKPGKGAKAGAAPPASPPVDDMQERRNQQTNRATRRLATISALQLHVGTGGQDRTPEVASDMVNAVLNDLSQTSLYGLSDERTDKVAEDLKVKVDSSRQLIGWGITTLPALGFLGTVHGILNALNGVSGLTQGDAAARLATLLNVSGALGLAFSTTLIALIGMMILTFFDIVQARSEKGMIEEFRDFLNDRVLA